MNRIKHFKRILKELGIYSIYIRDIKNQRIGSLEKNLGDVETFSQLIDESFTWSFTENEQLWEKLYDITCGRYCEDMIYNKECLNEIKEKIKCYI